VSGASWPWDLLDIQPTDDRKTIREAYARKLKAVDQDAAPELFMGLRDARDAALSGEFLGGAEASVAGSGKMARGFDDPLAEAPPADAIRADEPGGRPQFTVEYDESDDIRFDRMVELFTGEGELGEADATELEHNLDVMFADNRMTDLGHFARVEIWLAELLAQHYPRAARFYPRIADRFQWNERAHELGIHPAIPWLVGAQEGRALVDAITGTDHPYHREWKELTQGRVKGPLFLRRVDLGRMGNLITSVRRDFPWLEQDHWQPELVARWEKKVGGGGVRGPGIWTWAILIFFALSALGRFADADSSGTDHGPAAMAALQAANADERIAEFIARFPEAQADGRSLETLRLKSPKTYSTLQRVAGEFETLDEARSRIMMREITETYYLIIDKMPYDTQVADAKFRADMVRTMKNDPQRCVEFIRNPRTFLRQGHNADTVPLAYQYLMFSVVHDQYGDREWALVQKTAEVPGDLIGKLVHRSGVPEERVRAVLRSRDVPEADVCRTMGSFFELLTEIPAKKASKILPAVL